MLRATARRDRLPIVNQDARESKRLLTDAVMPIETLASVIEWTVEVSLRNEFTAVFERDGRWHIAYCPDIPGANGQGLTRDKARRSLLDAIRLIPGGPPAGQPAGRSPDAEREKVLLEQNEAIVNQDGRDAERGPAGHGQVTRGAPGAGRALCYHRIS